MDRYSYMRGTHNYADHNTCRPTAPTPAMAYVPDQKFTQTYDLCQAWKAGTIFPELYKPFCGKGGGVCR